MKKEKGVTLDPYIFDYFLQVFDNFVKVFEEKNDTVVDFDLNLYRL